jgi:uncharacterized repeat protein (TIGR04138 family)
LFRIRNKIRLMTIIARRLWDCVQTRGVLLLRLKFMQDLDFPEVVALIRKEDPRFDRKAYDFVRQGLDHAVKELKKKDSARIARTAHVTGPELLEGLRAYALDQYGPLSKTVLNSWGVKRCSDFGDIVFNMIEYNVLSKTENDRREDFSDIYSFDEAFVKPFLPTKPRSAGSSPSATEPVGSA